MLRSQQQLADVTRVQLPVELCFATGGKSLTAEAALSEQVEAIELASTDVVHLSFVEADFVKRLSSMTSRSRRNTGWTPRVFEKPARL